MVDEVKWQDSYLAQIAELIKQHGWAIQMVAPVESDPLPHLSFGYTVGLLERGCAAEIMLVGLDALTTQAVLNEIAASMANGTGIPPSSWDLSGGYMLKPVFMTRSESPLHYGVAKAYYERSGIPMVQYVWPAKNHAYPWEDGWPLGPDVQPVGGAGRPLGA